MGRGVSGESFCCVRSCRDGACMGFDDEQLHRSGGGERCGMCRVEAPWLLASGSLGMGSGKN